MRPSNLDNRKLIIVAISSILAVTPLLLYFNLVDSNLSLLTSFALSTTSTHDPITYLPYTFGFATLLQTLHAYDYAGWKNIVIIDNSWDHHAFAEHNRLLREFSSVRDIVRTPVQLRFSQLQGFMDGMAREDGAEVYLWGHTDMILLRNETHPYGEMLHSLDLARSFEQFDLDGPVAVVYFLYDILSAVFVKPSASAPWDPAMPQYGSDCDRYHRLRLAGYSTLDNPNPIGHIVHMHGVLSHEEKMELWESGLTLDEQVQMLEDFNSATEQYGWRKGAGEAEEDGDLVEEADYHDGIQRSDREAAMAEGNGGRGYYEAKWGPFDCNLTDRTPAFDIRPLL